MTEDISAVQARVESRLRWMPRLLLAVTFTILGLSLLSVIVTYGAASSTSAVNRSQKITDCKSKESAKVTQAQTSLIRAGQARDSATQEYLQAVAQDDDATAARLLETAPRLRAEVARLSDELDRANLNYQAKLIQSREDVAAFLRECDL